MPIETLHAHTTASDGILNHLELLDTCQKYNVGVVAFTDHDSLPNKNTIKLLNEHKNHPTRWIIGIEISSSLPKELGGKAHSGLHIVGLFVDPTNKELLEYSKLAKEARITRMQRMVKNLQSIGFEITEADCLKASGGEVVASPHVVEALQSKPNNLTRIEELRKQMEETAKNDLEIKKEYDIMMSSDPSHYPYTLFLSERAYIKNIHVPYLYSTNLDKTVELIRNAGGVAIIAHYHTVRDALPKEKIEELIKDKRLDGIETVFGLWSYGTTEEPLIKEYRDFAENIVKNHNCLSSGGADVHKETDLKDFSEKTWYSHPTIGMAQKILKNKKINSRWSSLTA